MDESRSPTARLAPLFELGAPELGDEPAYVSELGLSQEDVPALVELARRWAEPLESEREGESQALWAPLHACCALAQLGAAEVVPTVLGMLDEIDDEGDDYYLELFPGMCARIGAPALDELERFALDPAHREYPRIAAAHGCKEIAVADPAARERAVATLARGLEQLDEMSSQLNAFFVSYLTDLRAVDHAALIRRAFEAGVVDTMVCGDWPRIAYELGIGPPPPRRKSVLERFEERQRREAAAAQRSGREKETRKARRKREKRARRKNRRK